MRKRVEALVNPALLIWARESAHLSLDIVAKKANIKVEQIKSWESGQSRPTVTQLIKLGEIYKRPISVFYLPKPPKEFDALHDYRRLPGQPAPELSPALAYEIRRARERREIALDLYELLGEKPPEIKLKISLDDDAEAFSIQIRKFLGIDIKEQIRWKTYYDAYNRWRGAIESSGFLCFQTADNKIKLTEMRGFSISQMPLPVIVINKLDFPAPKIFSLMHELSHILLGKEGICEFEEAYRLAPEEQKVEIFCNHLAGAVLVPKDDLLMQKTVKRLIKINSIEDSDIKYLAQRYKVSKEVILRRLLHFRYISHDFYKEHKEIYDKEAIQKALEEDHKSMNGEKVFFLPMHIRIISCNGRNLTNLILSGYYQEKITLSEVSDYLGIKLKYLPKIEAEISKHFSFI